MIAIDGTRFRRLIVAVLLVGNLALSQGCATLAHRSSYSYAGKESITSCEEHGNVCPWLIGDALLLLPGVVPGVIAFAVDFGTGAWRHDEFPATTTPPDEVTDTDDSQKTEWFVLNSKQKT